MNSLIAIAVACCSLFTAHYVLDRLRSYPVPTQERLALCVHGNFHPDCKSKENR